MNESNRDWNQIKFQIRRLWNSSVGLWFIVLPISVFLMLFTPVYFFMLIGVDWSTSVRRVMFWAQTLIVLLFAYWWFF